MEYSEILFCYHYINYQQSQILERMQVLHNVY